MDSSAACAWSEVGEFGTLLHVLPPFLTRASPAHRCSRPPTPFTCTCILPAWKFSRLPCRVPLPISMLLRADDSRTRCAPSLSQTLTRPEQDVQHHRREPTTARLQGAPDSRRQQQRRTCHSIRRECGRCAAALPADANAELRRSCCQGDDGPPRRRRLGIAQRVCGIFSSLEHRQLFGAFTAF